VIKMRILICVSEYFPQGSGIANVVYNIVEPLKKLGVDCVICSPVGPDIKINALNDCGLLGLLYFWNNVRTFFSNKELDYDVVWMHNPLFLKKPPFDTYVVTIHTTAIGQITKKIYPAHLHAYKKLATIVETYCFKRLNSGKIQFTAITPQIRQELREFVSQKIHIISNGADVHRFFPHPDRNSIRSKYKIPIDAEVFLSVGRLTDMKRPFEMVELFKKISETRNKAILLVAGKGELFNSLSQFVENQQLENVILLGFVPESDLPDIYACADYYLSTSRYEGQPLTLLEAMASGLPCIVPDIPSFEIVNDAECGIMLNFENPGESAAEIIKYLNSEHRTHSINARKFAEKALDWEIIAKEYLTIFYEAKGESTIDTS
jgi:1,2-diacylglycerol 3-alpha-glucosyltransferase